MIPLRLSSHVTRTFASYILAAPALFCSSRTAPKLSASVLATSNCSVGS